MLAVLAQLLLDKIVDRCIKSQTLESNLAKHRNIMRLAAVFEVMLSLACSVMDGTKQCSAE